MTLLAAMQEKRGNCSFVHSIATILNVHVQILTSFLHFLNYFMYVFNNFLQEGIHIIR